MIEEYSIHKHMLYTDSLKVSGNRCSCAATDLYRRCFNCNRHVENAESATTWTGTQDSNTIVSAHMMSFINGDIVYGGLKHTAHYIRMWSPGMG